jgi:hypothetical protein
MPGREAPQGQMFPLERDEPRGGFIPHEPGRMETVVDDVHRREEKPLSGGVAGQVLRLGNELPKRFRIPVEVFRAGTPELEPGQREIARIGGQASDLPPLAFPRLGAHVELPNRVEPPKLFPGVTGGKEHVIPIEEKVNGFHRIVPRPLLLLFGDGFLRWSDAQ